MARGTFGVESIKLVVGWLRGKTDASTEKPSSGHFDEMTFRNRERFRENYQELCDALADIIPFSKLLDLGCANGFVLEAMHAKAKEVKGVELSAEVLPLLPPAIAEKVQIASATSLGKIGDFDLVTCIEVAEHVPYEQSPALVETITANSKEWVYFTAASPYQPGHGHINCQQQFYWINLFRKRGFDLDWDRTETLVGRIRELTPAKWLPMNSLVFRRHGA